MKIRAVPTLFLASALGFIALSDSKDKKNPNSEGENALTDEPGFSKLRDTGSKVRKRVRNVVTSAKTTAEKAQELCGDLHRFSEYYEPTLPNLALALACAPDFPDSRPEPFEDEEVYEICDDANDCEWVVVGVYDVTARDFLFENECPASDEWCSSINVDGVNLECTLRVVCRYDTESGITYSCQYTGDIEGVDVGNYGGFARYALAHEPDPLEFCRHVADAYMTRPLELCRDDEMSMADDCFSAEDADVDQDTETSNCIEIENGRIMCDDALQKLVGDDTEGNWCDEDDIVYEDFIKLGCDPDEW